MNNRKYRLLPLFLALSLLFTGCSLFVDGTTTDDKKSTAIDDSEWEDLSEQENTEIEVIGPGVQVVVETEPEEPENPKTPYDTVLKLSEAEALPDIADCTANQVFIYDVNAERVTYIKGTGEQLYPASITKLATIQVCFEYLAEDDTFTIGNEVTSAKLDEWVQSNYAVAWMVEDMEITAGTAAEGMLLVSGSDAAYALGAAAARKEQNNSEMSGTDALNRTVELMNEFAADQGMSGTHFSSVDGHSDSGNYSTIEDMALLAVSSYHTPIIRKYCGVASDTVTFGGQSAITWENSNWLMQTSRDYYCPYVKGMKTGTLDGSANIIILAEKDDQTYLIGVFSAASDAERYNSSLAIIRYLFGDWEA